MAQEGLFDYVAFVTLSDEGKPELEAVFPENKKDDTRGILHFCWPEGKAAVEQTLQQTRSENFSFVLTESDGSKRFGYCRRFLKTSPPECFCVVSRLPSPVLFQELLTVVELRRSQSPEMCMSFLAACHEATCPAPGSSVTIRVNSITGQDGVWDEHTLRRPEVNEVLLDYVTFFTLFSCVSVKNVIHLFSNAMLERRIILVAENLATLSSCVMAASNLLQPFHWQHVYIPVLPLVLIDYCFTTEHQILTNEGFLFMRDFQRRREDTSKPPLLVAGYDDVTGHLVYEAAQRLVVNQYRTQDVIEFVQGDNDQDVEDWARVSLVVTPEHDMYVDCGGGGLRKTKAEGLLKMGGEVDLSMLSCPPRGLATASTETRCWTNLPFVSEMGLRSLNEVDVYLADCGRLAYQVESFPTWVWMLDVERVRVIVAAMVSAKRDADVDDDDEHSLAVHSELFRDDCVRLLMHAGYQATFYLRPEEGSPRPGRPWFVSWKTSASLTLKQGAYSVRKRVYTGQTWCVSVAHGFVVARRAKCDPETGCVVRASVPVMTGNCTAPMPFFVGVLKSCLPVLESMPLEEVLVLDVENDRFLKDPGFEDTLPKESKKKLAKTLKAISITPERDSDLQIASTFYQFFFELFAGYEQFYELKDIPPGKGERADAPPKQGYRFDMPRFLATKTPAQRGFIEHLDQVQIMQSFFQENENPDRRYKFVDQKAYTQHLAANQLDQEVAEAMRAASRALGSAWQGMKEAAAKKRAQRKEDEAKAAAAAGSSPGGATGARGFTLRGNKAKAAANAPNGESSPSPVRVPASENIDLILANEKKQNSPSMARRAPTHRPCVSCHIYIDLSFTVCPHCSKEQPARTPITGGGASGLATQSSPNLSQYTVGSRPPPPSIAAPSNGDSPNALLDDKYKQPPPRPPGKASDSAAKRATLRKPPPPPTTPKSSSMQALPPVESRPPPSPRGEETSSTSPGGSVEGGFPDISTLHLHFTAPEDADSSSTAASRLSHTLSEIGMGEDDEEDEEDPYAQFTAPKGGKSPRHHTATATQQSAHHGSSGGLPRNATTGTIDRGHRRIQSSYEPRQSWDSDDTESSGNKSVSPREPSGKRTATVAAGRPAGWTSVKAVKKWTPPSSPQKEYAPHVAVPPPPPKPGRSSSQTHFERDSSHAEAGPGAAKRRPAPPPPPPVPSKPGAEPASSPMLPPKKPAGAAAAAPSPGKVLPFCVYCGERAERSDAKFCITCGKEIHGTAKKVHPKVPGGPAPTPKKEVNLVLPSHLAQDHGSNSSPYLAERQSRDSTRVRLCEECGAENTTIASHCVNCKMWF